MNRQERLVYTNLYQAGLGGFSSAWYWSSTESTTDYAWGKDFDDGTEHEWEKDVWPDYVRAIRAFTVGVATPAEAEPTPWVRNVQMRCYQIWINEDNNHVKIYDMEGSEVFAIDMKYGNAKFEAELPDGMYIVKTFHLSGTPSQEFIIGKP